MVIPTAVIVLGNEDNSDRHRRAIGRAITAQRSALLLSRKQLAHLLGVTPQAVGRWERAETAPSADNVSALLGLLQLDPLVFIPRRAA